VPGACTCPCSCCLLPRAPELLLGWLPPVPLPPRSACSCSSLRLCSLELHRPVARVGSTRATQDLTHCAGGSHPRHCHQRPYYAFLMPVPAAAWGSVAWSYTDLLRGWVPPAPPKTSHNARVDPTRATKDHTTRHQRPHNVESEPGHTERSRMN